MSDFNKLAEVLKKISPEEAEKEFRKEMGIDLKKVLQQQAAVFKNKGIIVALGIGRERFSHFLSLDDLGIQKGQSESFKEYLDSLMLGKRLFLNSTDRKKEAWLGKVEGKARRLLTRYSFPIRLGFGRDIQHFVPVKHYKELLSLLEEEKKKYFRVLEEIVDDLSSMKRESSLMLQRAASDIYKRLETNQSFSEFQQEFVGRAMQHFPTPSEVRGRAYFEVQTMIMNFEQTANIGDVEVLKDIKESIEKQKTAFVSDVVGHLYKTVHDITVTVSETLREKGSLSTKKTNSLLRTIEMFNLLNDIVSDVELAERLGKLEGLLESEITDKDTVMEEVRGLQTLTRPVLEGLGKAPRATRKGAEIASGTTFEAKSRLRRGELKEVLIPEIVAGVRKERATEQIALW